MPEKRKKPAKKTKKQSRESFSLSSLQKAAVITLCSLIVIAAGTGLYLRASINRRIEADLQSARELHGAGEYGEALSLLENVIERRPILYENTAVKYMMAEAFSQKSRRDEAAAIWEEIASGDPDERYYPASLFHLAVMEKEAGDASSAAETFKKITEDFKKSDILPRAHFELAESCRNTRRWSEAKEHYEKVITEFPETEISERAKDNLGELNIYLVHSPAITGHDIAYEVRPGDTLQEIARRHNTTVELIMKANELPGAMIPAGKRLKLTPSNFEIFVDADENTLTLHLNGRFFKRYIVGTGEYGKTPIGEFKITNKMKNPVWYSEDGVFPFGHPENILGTRWLGLDRRGYGIHGTTMPESIGKHETAGCIRMHNEEAEELYDLVIVGTPVTITGTALPDAW